MIVEAGVGSAWFADSMGLVGESTGEAAAAVTLHGGGACRRGFGAEVIGPGVEA